MGWSRATVLDVAKRTGYPVVEAWSGRNQGLMGTVYGPMLHHTGSTNPSGADYPTLKVVRDGRADLANSLCMYGLGKSGTIYCVSEKISWHAGAGIWNGVTDGNGHFAGIEAESAGTGKDWTPAQLDSYEKLCASILMETGRGVEWMVAHKEFALPKGRKPDPVGIDMAAMRVRVALLLGTNLQGIGGGYDDMPLSDDDVKRVANAVWGGIAGGNLVNNYRLGRGEWAGTILGGLESRFEREILPPALEPIKKQIAELAAKAALPASGAVTDAKAVADALIANPAFAQSIAKIAAELTAAELARRLQS